MAVYYVDPYIEASVGGIQGTNIPSASVLTSAVISTSSHFGLIIRVLNTSGGYSNTYTVKNIQYTLT